MASMLTQKAVLPRFSLWLLPGMVFILLAMALFALQLPALFWQVSALLLAGSFASCKWQLKGAASVGLIFAAVLLFYGTAESRLWICGLILTGLFPFTIFALSSQEISERQIQAEETVSPNWQALNEALSTQNESLEKSFATALEQMNALKKENECLLAEMKGLRKLRHVQEKLQKRNQDLQNKLHAKETDNQILRDKVHHLNAKIKTEEERAPAIVQEAPPTDLKSEHWQEMRRFQGMYCQLKQQFEEKCLTLDSTRKELFYAQEELSATKMELQEKEYDFVMEDVFIKMENSYLETQENLIMEVSLLEDIITRLSSVCSKN
jgi:hypothetical protein